MGTEITMTEAIHEDSVTVAWISESELSSLGIRMAEKANDIPMTMWNEAVKMAAIICERKGDVNIHSTFNIINKITCGKAHFKVLLS